jgi:uncharacterized protein with FMN-binding domain
MRRALIIAGGTIGGLGAVLTITPPNLSSTTSLAGGIPQASPSSTPSATPSASGKPTKKPTTKPNGKPTKKPTTKPNGKPTKKPTTKPNGKPTGNPTPTATQPSSGASGSFTGDPVSIRYGTVQVKITVQNGKITDAQALQAPTGSNDRYTQMAVPKLREQTIAAQSANIQGVSGASFTSYGWYTSLVSAVAKAGL